MLAGAAPLFQQKVVGGLAPAAGRIVRDQVDDIKVVKSFRGEALALGPALGAVEQVILSLVGNQVGRLQAVVAAILLNISRAQVLPMDQVGRICQG